MFGKRSLLIPVVLLFCVSIFSGCGKSGPKVVKVSGKIHFQNINVPASGGVMYFAPVGEVSGKRPTMCHFDQGGNFRVSSFKKNDGMTPGTYKVTLECLEAVPTMENPHPKNLIPTAYTNADTTLLEIVVGDRGGTYELTVEG